MKPWITRILTMGMLLLVVSCEEIIDNISTSVGTIDAVDQAVLQEMRDQEIAGMAVGIIQNGTLPNEKIALGTINTIVEAAADEKIAAPAVIVIGEVVRQHNYYNVLKQEWNIHLN